MWSLRKFKRTTGSVSDVTSGVASQPLRRVHRGSWGKWAAMGSLGQFSPSGCPPHETGPRSCCLHGPSRTWSRQTLPVTRIFPGKGTSICFSFMVSPADSHSSWAQGPTAMGVACLAVVLSPFCQWLCRAQPAATQTVPCRTPDCRAQGAGPHTAAAGQTARTVMRGWAAPSEAGGHVGVRGTSTGAGSG